MKIIKQPRETFERIYERLEATFPPNELKSKRTFYSLIDDGAYDIIEAFDEISDAYVGFALLHTIEATQTLWLDFIAIDEKQRSKGYGSRFFNALCAYYMPKYTGMLLEVEIPTGEDENQLRRIRYYENLGASVLPMVYALPTYEGAFPMHLMYKGLQVEAVPEPTCILASIKAAFNYVHRDIPHKDAVYTTVKWGKNI